MMRLILITLVVLLASCARNRDNQKDITNTELSDGFDKIDTVGQIKEIEERSIKDTTIDVLKYFTDIELPDIYRLGGVTYQPYLLDNQLVKVVLDFEGDRETLTKSYYLNDKQEIFYVSLNYSIYDPPKWEEGTKKVSELQSYYFITNDKVRKSVGENLVEPDKIIEGINKLKQLNQKL